MHHPQRVPNSFSPGATSASQLSPKLRSSYIDTVLKLFLPFEGNHKADVAPGENEFGPPDL